MTCHAMKKNFSTVFRYSFNLKNITHLDHIHLRHANNMKLKKKNSSLFFVDKNLFLLKILISSKNFFFYMKRKTVKV